MLQEESELLAALPFNNEESVSLVAVTADDIKFPAESDGEYFRKLPIEINPLAAGWRCINRAPTTVGCLERAVDILSVANPADGSWWIDQRGFVHMLFYSVQQKDGAFTVKPSVLRRANKKVLSTAFGFSRSKRITESRADEIRAAGSVEKSENGTLVPTIPTQLLVPEAPRVTSAAAAAAAAAGESSASSSHLGLPAAPRITAAAKQAARRPAEPVRLVTACWQTMSDAITSECSYFEDIATKLLERVDNRERVYGIHKTKTSEAKSFVMPRESIIMKFANQHVSIQRYVMILLCALPVVKPGKNDDAYLSRPDALELRRLWTPEVPSQPVSDSVTNQSAAVGASLAVTSPTTTMSKLPKVSAKSPAPKSAVSSAASAPEGGNSSDDVFMLKMDKLVNKSTAAGNPFYESGACFAQRYLECPDKWDTLLTYCSDMISGNGSFDANSKQMKAAANVRASELRTMGANWKAATTKTDFVMFGVVPAMTAIKGFLDNGVRDAFHAELETAAKQVAAAKAEASDAKSDVARIKRRLDEAEEELEVARKAIKNEPNALEADMDC